jgi:small GTP-binding protein
MSKTSSGIGTNIPKSISKEIKSTVKMMEPDDHMRSIELKVLLLGYVSVGKTSIMQRYCFDHFSRQYKTTIGLDCGVKKLEWKSNYKLNIQFWDISGQERFGKLSRVFYKGACGAFIVFDLSEPISLEKAIEWKKDLDIKLPGIPCTLVGNKCDLISLIPMEDIEMAVRTYEFPGKYINVSAKKDINIRIMMNHLIELMVEEVPQTPRTPLVSPRSAQEQYPEKIFRVKYVGEDQRENDVIRLNEKNEEEEGEEECCWLI